MMKIIVYLLACIYLVSGNFISELPLPQPHQMNDEVHIKSLFAKFTAYFGKKYEGGEYLARMRVFADNLKSATDMNAKREKATDAFFGITEFSDLTNAEFRSIYMGKANPKTVIPSAEPKKKERVSVNAPSQFDWRPKGAVTAVKNQKQCGSCWAFSATEQIESQWILAGHATNTTIDLAPQQIVDCDQGSMGCGGGTIESAFGYVEAVGGQESEKDYPYTAQDGQCKFNKAKVAASITSWKYADHYYSESELKETLATEGPPSICIDAANWQNYHNGTMTASQCCWICMLDHCVQAVGYNLDAEVPYWIVRNSWSTKWGIDGFIHLEYGYRTCAIGWDTGIVTVPKKN